MEALTILLLWLFPIAVITMAGALIVGLILFWIRKDRTPRLPRSFFWVFGVSTTLAVLLWISFIYPLMQMGRQKRTLTDMQIASQHLMSYNDAHADFPERLSDALPQGLKISQDAWLHDFQYERRPGAFILVSYGRDGEPDGLDYWALREKGKIELHSRKFDADLVVSDRGWLWSAGM